MATKTINLNKHQTILDILVSQGIISDSQKNEILSRAQNNQEITEIIKEKKIADDNQLAKAYSVLDNLPFVHLPSLIPSEILEKIPREASKKYKVIAYGLGKGVLKVAVADPSELQPNVKGVMNELGSKRGLRIDLAVTTQDDFDKAFRGYFQKTPESPKPKDVQSEKQDGVEENTSLEFIDLSKIEIDKSILDKFPKDIAAKYRMICFGMIPPNTINVALENSDESKTKDILKFIEAKNDLKINRFKTDTNGINFALRLYDKIPKPLVPLKPSSSLPQEPKKDESLPPKQEENLQQKAKIQELDELEEKNLDQFLEKPINNPADLEQIVRAGFVPKILAAIIYLAIKMQASDIHIEPMETHVRLRYRVDGILQDIIKLPLAMSPEIISRIKILGKMKIDEHRIPQDGRLEAIALKHEVDLRISTLPTVNGEKGVLRILDKSVSMYTLEEIGLLQRNFEVVSRNIKKPFGVILATGPTGSGKTTTLYSILNSVSTPGVNIITLEDPVEYEIPGINQCQIKPKIGFSFANGLRSILRQDPNVIMVGEIRDSETAQMATHAALTGHLVLSTLHTNDAAGALPRLINMGVEPFLITSAINIILAQRLVRKLCQECREIETLSLSTMQEIEKELSYFKLKKPFKFYKGKGCDKCTKGYKGRVGIFEVLEMTDKIEALANSRATTDRIKEQAIADGMITLKQDGLLKALQGVTSVEEVFASTMR